MMLGNFWGFTAPMFVLAFDEREEPLALFNEMAKHESSACLKGLQKELFYLTKVAELVEYRPTLNTMEMIGGDDEWQNGCLQKHPEFNEIFKQELIQRIAVKCSEREKRGQFKNLMECGEKLEECLQQWHGKLSDADRVVSATVKELGRLEESGTTAAIEKLGLQLQKRVVDSVTIDGVECKLSEVEQRVCEYFVQRLSDIYYWIDRLYSNDAVQESVWGVPFFQIAKRKPESIWYTVYGQFEQIQNIGNVKVLYDKVEQVRDSVATMRKCYQQFVECRGDATESAAVTWSVDGAEEFFTGIPDFCADNYLSNEVELLQQLHCACRRVESESIKEKFGYQGDLNKLGKELVKFGVVGINGQQQSLFVEAVQNTILSTNKIFVTKEIKEQVFKILDNDVEALLETIMPVGEVIA